MEDYCAICSEDSNTKYVHTLPCGHKFHYECIQKSFQYDRTKMNQCPACRKPSGLLPLVNGLPKLLKNIHYYNTYPKDYKVTRCVEILKSGKRKGVSCSAKCMLGFTICKRHHTSKIKKEAKMKEKQNKTANKPANKTAISAAAKANDLNTNQQTIVV